MGNSNLSSFTYNKGFCSDISIVIVCRTSRLWNVISFYLFLWWIEISIWFLLHCNATIRKYKRTDILHDSFSLRIVCLYFQYANNRTKNRSQFENFLNLCVCFGLWYIFILVLFAFEKFLLLITNHFQSS